MTLPLRPVVKNALLILTCLGMLSIYLDRVIVVYLAQRSANSSQAEAVERAIRLVPDDAE